MFHVDCLLVLVRRTAGNPRTTMWFPEAYRIMSHKNKPHRHIFHAAFM
jgi:hypothetical protein